LRGEEPLSDIVTEFIMHQEFAKWSLKELDEMDCDRYDLFFEILLIKKRIENESQEEIREKKLNTSRRII